MNLQIGSNEAETWVIFCHKVVKQGYQQNHVLVQSWRVESKFQLQYHILLQCDEFWFRDGAIHGLYECVDIGMVR